MLIGVHLGALSGVFAVVPHDGFDLLHTLDFLPVHTSHSTAPLSLYLPL